MTCTQIQEFSHFFPLHSFNQGRWVFFFDFQIIRGRCRAVINIRLTRFGLTNWCFGPMTAIADDGRIICTVRVCAPLRLKWWVSIWLSFQHELNHLQKKKRKKKEDKNTCRAMKGRYNRTRSQGTEDLTPCLRLADILRCRLNWLSQQQMNVRTKDTEKQRSQKMVEERNG